MYKRQIISSAAAGLATAAAVGATAAAVGVIGSAVGTGINMYTSTKDRKNAARAAAGIQGEIDFLAENRTEIINPFADVTNLSDMATNLSGMATDLSGLITDSSAMRSNPYADLSVATQAAEFEAEEADIALANTLDMLAATGSSAGGATALAQAALQSKRGISSSIEQQEQANQTLAAKGEESLQQAKQRGLERVQDAQFGEGRRIQDIEMSEAARLQNFQISEAGRMQEVGVKAALFNYTEEDKRDLQDLDRATSLLYAEKGVEAQAKANYSNAITSGVGSLTNVATSYIGTKG